MCRSPPAPQSCATPYRMLPVQDNLPTNTTAKSSMKVMGWGENTCQTGGALHFPQPNTTWQSGTRSLGEATPYLLTSSARALWPNRLPSTCLPPACKPWGSVQGVTGELAATRLGHPSALLQNQALCTPCFCRDEAADIKET